MVSGFVNCKTLNILVYENFFTVTVNCSKSLEIFRQCFKFIGLWINSTSMVMPVVPGLICLFLLRKAVSLSSKIPSKMLWTLFIIFPSYFYLQMSILLCLFIDYRFVCCTERGWCRHHVIPSSGGTSQFIPPDGVCANQFERRSAFTE